MIKKQLANQMEDPLANEQGQSIVLIALALLGLIAMIGLAVDVGLVFARGAQLQAAVDAAALAGVTEFRNTSISLVDQKANADDKALQFIKANEMPLAVLEADWVDEPIYVVTDTATTPIGERRYGVDAYWTFDLFFLRIIGRDQIQIMRHAQAAFFPLADIYASRRVEDGIVSTSNQGVFGPDVCTRWGDPFSPRGGRDNDRLPKPANPDGTYSYTYRILVPKSYRENNRYLQIELFDPETHNQDITTQPVSITHSSLAQDFGYPATESTSCEIVDPDRTGDPPTKRWNPCLIPTGELGLTSVPTASISLDQINPYWIVRIDENRGNGSTACEPERQSVYNESVNTETRFQLYYFQEQNNGTIGRINLGSYLGKADNRDDTDLKWVTPGIPPTLALEAGSRISSFRLDLQEINGQIAGDVPGILVDAATEDIYIYLDVTSISGGSENGFEIWAGPPSDPGDFPANVNERNLYILDNPGTHNSEGVVVFAVGNLPMNSNFGLRDNDVRNGDIDQPEKLVEVDIPLIYVGPEYAGAEITISLFDPDAGAIPPITFYFDSVSEDDWSKPFGDVDAGRCFETDDIVDAKDPYACNNDWVDPYEFRVPGVLDNCDWSQTPLNADDCTPFYGGRLVARYRGGFSDTFGWQISVEGLPFLTE